MRELLQRVLDSGALSAEQFEALEAEVCAALLARVEPENSRAAYEAFYTEKAKTLPLALGNGPLRYAGGQYINDFALFGWMVWEEATKCPTSQ